MIPLINHPQNTYTAGRYLRCTIALTCIVLLNACSSYSAKQDTNIPLDKGAYLDIPDTWTIHAKLGIKNAEDSGSVTLKWEQIGDNYTIQMSGPFGQGNAKLSGNRSAIIIERPGKETLYSRNPKSLIQQTFGWDLPIEQLPYWMRGLQTPDPISTSFIDTGNNLLLSNQKQLHTPAYTRYNETGTLSKLSQFGWDIHYSRYKVQQLYLAPHKIRASNHGVTLTLIIKKWEFPSITETVAKTSRDMTNIVTHEAFQQPTNKTVQKTT
jgi:outer membrane lipoprotein LolB